MGALLASRLVGRSVVKAATMETNVNGSRKKELWPLNRHVFDEDFSRMEATANNGYPDSVAPTCSEEPSIQTTAKSATDGRHTTNPMTSATTVTDVDSYTRSSGPAIPVTSCPDDGEAATTTARPLRSRPSGSLSTGFADTSTATPSGSTPQTPAISSQTTRSNNPASVPGFAGLHSVPTKGGGRCPPSPLPLRTIAITLNPALQSGEQNPLTGDRLGEVKSPHETALADNLRSRVISLMCETLTVEASAAARNVKPKQLYFRTVAERILHMSNPQSIASELEIKSTAEELVRPVHVMTEGTGHVFKHNNARKNEVSIGGSVHCT